LLHNKHSLPGFIIILLCIYLPGGAQVAFTRLPRPTNLRQWGPYPTY